MIFSIGCQYVKDDQAFVPTRNEGLVEYVQGIHRYTQSVPKLHFGPLGGQQNMSSGRQQKGGRHPSRDSDTIAQCTYCFSRDKYNYHPEVMR